jgi:hypothetical protein
MIEPPPADTAEEIRVRSAAARHSGGSAPVLTGNGDGAAETFSSRI